MILEFRGYEGVTLVAEAVGDSHAPAVLLLHDAGQDRSGWAAVARALAEAGRRAIAYDARGRGDSERSRRDDLDAEAGDLRAVLEAIGSRPVMIAAGAAAAVAIAALGEGGEHLATGLVLVGPRDIDSDRLVRAAAAVRVPTLVLGGAEPAIADAEVARLDGDGEAFNAQLLDFLERRVPRAVPEYRAGSDARTLRDALGCFATGVTVVTTLDEAGRPVGLTANSFTSVSLEPPLLLVCLAKTAGSLPAFAAAPGFAVNVLHTGQQTVSARFASKTEDRFAATPWETWDTGAPIVEHSLASFDCTRHAWHDAGDHVILVGRVQRVRFEPRRDPLLYFRGRYRRLHFS
jgi:flavin reductase (DIM6/NTAB) family NADH-FMN oxidoreductase RutF